MLTAELGAGPLALARAQRAQTARILIETTGLGLAEIAFAAGFGSVRQFNDTIREVYAPRPVGSCATAARPRSRRRPVRGTITLRLAYRPPLHAAALLDFLGGAGDARRRGGRRRDVPPRVCGCRTAPATVALTPADGYVAATLRLADVRDLAPAVARCRRLFDLDADPAAVDADARRRPGAGRRGRRRARRPGAARGRRLRDRRARDRRPADLVAGARTVLDPPPAPAASR